MPIRPPVHRPAHLGARQITKRQTFDSIDQRRESSTKRGYGYQWQKARKAFLAVNSVCVTCRAQAATVVDHIRRHNGDQTLFWDQLNWQALCATCHAAKSPHDVFGRLKG